jgi:hypothetical protein
MSERECKLKRAKGKSSHGQNVIILETNTTRESFKYERGELIEYTCGFYGGRPVRLTREEKGTL